MEWWQRVTQGREAQKLTMTAFGHNIGVKVQRISDIEAGRHKNPSLKTLRKIAGGLGLTVGELVGDRPTRANNSDTHIEQGGNGVTHSRVNHVSLQGGVLSNDPVVVAAQFDRLRSDLDAILRHAGHALEAIPAPAATRAADADKTG